jgi:hypothetical protein
MKKAGVGFFDLTFLLKGRLSFALLLDILFFIILISGCIPTTIIREIHDPTKYALSDSSKKNIKVHMKNGCLYLLDSCTLIQNTDTLHGYGTYYNQYRKFIGISKVENLIQPFVIPLNDVALFETNKLEGVKSKILTMSIVGVPTELISWYCILNPKACFGSCPTFYGWDGEEMSLMAEGFSSSILKSFEKKDIDMLYWSKSQENKFHLRLSNEALETHIIRYADLMIFPHKSNERVFATEDERFFATSNIQKPASCIAAEGECLEKVLQMDHQERYSSADPKNLACREYVEMSFDSVPEGDLGLIMGCRQTLLTTFLYYQSLAYMGNSAGYFAARAESGDRNMNKRINNAWDLLGGIEVFVQNSKGKWTKVNQVEEMGPIASDIHLVTIPNSGTPNLRIKLRLTKGLWRLDYLALGKLERQIEPVKIQPSSVMGANGKDDYTRSLLTDTLQPLVTLPGDVYDLYYDLPEDSSVRDFYLSSKGYYLEWMREEWRAEENLKKVSLMFGAPKLFLRIAAPDFAKIEHTMEDNFWNSRYVKKN